MPPIPDLRLMLFKQDSQLKQGSALNHSLFSQPDAGTNRGIEHPCRHTLGRTVGKPDIDHIPRTASRTKRFALLSEPRMKWIENLRKQTDTRIVERACLSGAKVRFHPSRGF